MSADHLPGFEEREAFYDHVYQHKRSQVMGAKNCDAECWQTGNCTGHCDEFSDAVLERIVQSNQDYQATHGHYIATLAAKLLDARRELALLRAK